MEGGDEQERKGIEGKSFIINDKCSLFHYLIHWMPSLYIILKDHWRLNFNFIFVLRGIGLLHDHVSWLIFHLLVWKLSPVVFYRWVELQNTTRLSFQPNICLVPLSVWFTSAVNSYKFFWFDVWNMLRYKRIYIYIKREKGVAKR